MIVRFITQDSRNLVWNNRRNLKDTGCFLNEDFSEETRTQRNTLYPIMKEARKKEMRPSLTGGTLIIEGHTYSVNTLHALRPEVNLVTISTCEVGDNAIAFCTHLSPLSNFYNSPFRVDGQRYSTVAQYFTYNTALAVHDDQTASNILSTTSPATIKRMGNSIRLPPGNKWNNEILQIMSKGCWEKFSQNPKLRQFLLNTGTKDLIETGQDACWGASVTNQIISWSKPPRSNIYFFEWGVYALSASKAIFRARTYNCITYSVR